MLFILLGWMLTTCAGQPVDLPRPATPPPLAAITVAEALASGGIQSRQIVGYLYSDQSGARIVNALSFSTAEHPQPLDPPERQIWLDQDPSTALGAVVRQVGSAKLALVLVTGVLDGPGQFGPGQLFRYRLTQPQFQSAPLYERTIAGILDDPSSSRDRLIRLSGNLLLSDSSSILVDKLSDRGVAEPGARQLKLSMSTSDPALLKRLQSSPAGTVWYGPVLVEGVWRGRAFLPLAIIPIGA